MDRTGLLKRATLLMGLVLLFGVGSVFLGSLTPSQRAVSLYEQGRFSESDIYHLGLGEVTRIDTQYGPMIAVRPNDKIRANLNESAAMVHFPEFNTYNEELDVFLFWAFADYSGGRPRCAIIYNGDLSPDSDDGSYAAFFDPCTGQQFDFAGRVMKTPFDAKIPNLAAPRVQRVNALEYQVLADPAPYSDG